MEYIIIAFRSRANTVKFYEILKANGVYGQIVNTPKEAGVGCGLSIKINNGSLISAKMILRKSDLNSFAGLFLVKESLNARFVKPIS